VFATRRCIGRVARPDAGHAPATFCAGVPLPAGRFTWPGRALSAAKLSWVSVP
jgi:hypothetical protein